MVATTTKVVIVGAGPAGLTAARALHGAADVTIIEPKGETKPWFDDFVTSGTRPAADISTD